MVSKPTVIVIGAGASKPYGYPSGPELVRTIIDSLANPHSNVIGGALLALGFQDIELQRFGLELEKSRVFSIDAFLERRQEHLALGKTAIAAALLPCEDESRLSPENGDWYRYLANKLRDNRDVGLAGHLTILTFNYDRSLEYYLYQSFVHSYGFTPREAQDALKTVQIIHLHGVLNPLPWQPKGDSEPRPYGKKESEIYVREAAKGIRIIHENTENNDAFVRARNALSTAKRVCFLGFGYHPTNVKRLLVNDWHKLPREIFWGTAYGLSHGEGELVKQAFDGTLPLIDDSSDCLAALRARVQILT